MIACTSRGGVPNVGGHSAASMTPSRPLVPAPTKMRRPPSRRAVTIMLTARAMSDRTRATARTARPSSRFMSAAIWRGRKRSSAPLLGFARSVARRA